MRMNPGDGNAKGRSVAAKGATRAAALLLGTAMVLFAIEVVARHTPAAKPYRVPTVLFRTIAMPRNSFNYRDYEYAVAKPPNTCRILIAGDSFTLGAAVNLDDTYPKKLEQFLNRYGNAGGTAYEVLNLSRMGRSTPTEAAVLMAYARRLKPDMVIIGYCLNDVEDWENRDYMLKLWEKCLLRDFKKPRGWRGFLYAHSAAARTVARRIFNTKAQRGRIKYYHKLYRDDFSGWQKGRKALNELGEFAREKHIKAGILIFPIFGYGLGDGYPFLAIHEKLHQAISDAGLDYLDLLPYYRGQDPNRLVVRPIGDTHPNEMAYRIAAEALWLRIKGYADPAPGAAKHSSRSLFPKRPPSWFSANPPPPDSTGAR